MIISTANAKVKWLLKLQQKRRIRETENLFVVEGLRIFEETPKEHIREVYVSESFYEKYEDKITLFELFKVEIVSESVFAHISDTKSPQGILCVVEMKKYTLEQMMEKKPAHLLILEDIRDPGNIGTILRSAEGAGVTGVLLSKNCVDMYNPKVIRSTMGSIYRVPFLYVEDLKETIGYLKEQNVRIYATHLAGTTYYSVEQYRESLAFVFGNEANGLSAEIAKLSDARVKIPMQGKVESLNVATAAAVFMFEVCRQRCESLE